MQRNWQAVKAQHKEFEAARAFALSWWLSLVLAPSLPPPASLPSLPPLPLPPSLAKPWSEVLINELEARKGKGCAAPDENDLKKWKAELARNLRRPSITKEGSKASQVAPEIP